MPARTQVVTIEEPRIARWLFGSSRTAWVWLIARVWLGWEWLAAGWGKVFGGTITWRVWNWGDAAYSLTGDGNIGWVRSGTVSVEGADQARGVGDAVAGFAQGAIASSEGPASRRRVLLVRELPRVDPRHRPPRARPTRGDRRAAHRRRPHRRRLRDRCVLRGHAQLQLRVRRLGRGEPGDDPGLGPVDPGVAQRRVVRRRPQAAPRPGNTLATRRRRRPAAPAPATRSPA